MNDLDGSVGVSESENVWREIWGERESKGRGREWKRERESSNSTFFCYQCTCGADVAPAQTQMDV